MRPKLPRDNLRHRRAAANYTVYKMGAIEGVFTEKAPKPLPQFSQAVKYNGMVYVSGNIGLDAATWKLVEGTVKDRTVRSNSLNALALIMCPIWTISYQGG